MKRSFYVAVMAALVLALWAPATLTAEAGGGSMDVIVLADGSTDALVEFIGSIGGTVRFQYRNVPAVAASIPIGAAADVGGFAGVAKVE